MKEIVKIDKEELVKFLDYLEDKVEECYKKEVKQSIERFLKKIEDIDLVEDDYDEDYDW